MWSTKKQKMVVVSSYKMEYMAGFKAVQECIWLQMLMEALGHSASSATTLLCNNNLVINLLEDPLLHAQVKHIDIKYHFLHEQVASKEISLQYINTKDNIADIFTKALPASKFTRL